MRRKVTLWIQRYFPAEMMGVLGALIGGMVSNTLFHNSIITALAGTWGENIAYYSVIIFNEVKKEKEKYARVTISLFGKIIGNLLLEFGLGEYLDSLIVRPFAMYLFPTLLHNLAMGLIVGKIAADIVFYIPTIISYEVKNKIFKEETLPVE